jgi:methylaspartate mutase sigma subunit
MALESLRARPLTVVVTGLSSDAHTWNLVYLQLVLEEMRCRVINLGACTPDETILATCLAQAPDLLVISSVNGHGVHDGLRLIRTLRAVPGLASLPVVIGGRLDASGGADRRTPERLIAAGFDSVLVDTAGITTFRSMVRRISGRLADSGEPIGAR